MRFVETTLAGAYVVEVEPQEDERGLFARTFCANEMRSAGLDPRCVQCNVSFNARGGTLRGMHWQAAPHGEIKLVRCTSGRIFDVIVDIRRSSDSFLQWFGVELSADKRNALYVPRGFAHGFQTLVDASEVFYQMSEYYQPGLSRGARYDDPEIGIEWPADVSVISERDAAHSGFREAID